MSDKVHQQIVDESIWASCDLDDYENLDHWVAANAPKKSLSFENTLASNKGQVRKCDKVSGLQDQTSEEVKFLSKKETKDCSLLVEMVKINRKSCLSKPVNKNRIISSRFVQSQKVVPCNQRRSLLSTYSVKELKPLWEEYRQKPSNEILQEIMP